MRVVEQNIIPRVAEGTGGRTVQFVYEDGQQAWVEVSDEDSNGMTDQQLIDHAEAKLKTSPAYELPAYPVADNSNLTADPSRSPQQPEGPVSKPNPLLDEQDEDANIVGMEGEGVIEP
ncbi:hypothetical protein [Phyllobacterium lublinensis]|uniref:hypothetical protein n=1 Tax=Phyllobacterium lublinensis TaxID=2875708 RepID=UPI001CCE3CA9|nr:hypothetical protein [Phyllobacterium sp. 2063]MBZ9654661.1 hypothetical protein [Phyllobacterium sp. 2063]